MQFIQKLKQNYNEQPLLFIFGTGAFVRLLAALFSGGYIASDDHFLVLHIAFRWLHGDPAWQNDPNYSGQSLLYPGAHYLFLRLCHSVGLTNTLTIVTLVRLLHAIWSLPVIWLGYKFVERLEGIDAAKLAGWLLALLWVEPIFSVRQLPEVVSAVPLFASLVMAERIEKKGTAVEWIAAGILLGIGFDLRYQVGFCGVGVFAALLLTKRPMAAMWYTIGALIGTTPLLLVNQLYLGSPLASPIAYLQYNASGAMWTYITRPWYNYLLLILGAFVPPFSFLILTGFFRAIRRAPLMFAATFVFLLIHSIIPNKQERFIGTIIPELVVLGVIGIYIWLNSPRKKLSPRFLRISLVIFWCLNLPLMALTVFTYNKRAQILSLASLQSKTELRGVVLDEREKDFLAPWFYLGDAWSKNKFLVEVKNDKDYQTVFEEAKQGQAPADYVIIYLEKNREQRKQSWESVFGKLVEEQRIAPSFVDELLHKMNPKYNPSFDAVVYRIVRK